MHFCFTKAGVTPWKGRKPINMLHTNFNLQHLYDEWCFTKHNNKEETMLTKSCPLTLFFFFFYDSCLRPRSGGFVCVLPVFIYLSHSCGSAHRSLPVTSIFRLPSLTTFQHPDHWFVSPVRPRFCKISPQSLFVTLFPTLGLLPGLLTFCFTLDPASVFWTSFPCSRVVCSGFCFVSLYF